MIIYKSQEEIEKIATACRLVADVLEELKKNIREDITTKELDRIAEDLIIKGGAKPAFKGYKKGGLVFPSALCTSINSEVVHGIPSKRKLKKGDLISIDVGVLKDGYYGDSAFSAGVGQVNPEVEELIRIAEEALYLGIEQAVEGKYLSDIGHAIQSFVEDQGYSVVRDFVGHGIGANLHEEPQVPNFGPSGRGVRLREGMVLAIEPMVNVGDSAVTVKEDNWTAVTADGSLSAHCEHTVAINGIRPRILSELES